MTLPARSGTIELIDKGSSSDTHPAPLLFVHGGWHAAWCWDEHFLDFFADAGYRAIALSLRGHGGSPTTKPLSSCSIADYVEDVRSVADGLPASPVLIGHSMGGFVVQKCLDGRSAPAAVLMASMPSHPARRLGVSWRSIRRHPLVALRANTVGSTADLVNTPRLAREFFFLHPHARIRCRVVCRMPATRELGRPGAVRASQARAGGDSAPGSRGRQRQRRRQR
jgi:pimeloyl-ACP methyl ester carboxylesterase